MGGMYMSMGYLTWFARDMIAGRGMISMSAMNIANGEPVGSALSALMFGTADALSNYLQTSGFPSELVFHVPLCMYSRSPGGHFHDTFMRAVAQRSKLTEGR